MSFRRLVRNMGIKEVLIAPRSPYQNLYVERVISSIRRDLLDRVIVLSERHLRRLLTQYMAYDHQYRTHLLLTMDGRESRPLSIPTKVRRQGPR
jgi:transposase InsO family protein